MPEPAPAAYRLHLVQAALVLAVLLAAPSRGSWGAGGVGVPPPGWKLGGDPVSGKQLYMINCATCHGEDGKGRGDLAGALNPKPQDLTDPRVMAQRSMWELYRIVRDGGPAAGLSPAMAGWKALLPDPDIRSITAFVRTLAPAQRARH